jgi:hypothetical protein
MNATNNDGLFDYAPILLKMDKLSKELHEACLHKQYDGALEMTNEMVVQTRMLRAWLLDKEAA